LVFVRLQATVGQEDEIRAALRTLVAASRDEPGCVTSGATRPCHNK
jgi:quinol monooxygenase YgiN